MHLYFTQNSLFITKISRSNNLTKTKFFSIENENFLKMKRRNDLR